MLNIPQDKLVLLPSHLQSLVKEYFECQEKSFVIGVGSLDSALDVNVLADLCRDMALAFESVDLFWQINVCNRLVIIENQVVLFKKT